MLVGKPLFTSIAEFKDELEFELIIKLETLNTLLSLQLGITRRVIAFLKELLCEDPPERFDIHQALNHIWITG